MSAKDRKRPWYEAEPTVVKELMTIVRVGVAALDHLPSAEITTILRAARLLPMSAGPNRQERLVSALFDEVLATDSSWVEGEVRRLAARDLFGHSDRTYGRGRSERLRIAAEHFYQAPETFRRVERNGEMPRIVRAAGSAVEAVIDVYSGPPTGDSSQYEETTTYHPYVPRPELEAQVQRLKDLGQNLILLHGDAGTGKSRLAHELAMKWASKPSDVVRIRANDERTLVGDIALALHKLGGETMAHPSVLKDRFSRTWSTRGTLEVVIVDNLDEPRIAESLFSHRPACPVLVTSRNSEALQGQGAELLVPNMAHDEAVAMAISVLPGTSAIDAEQLARRLEGRPLAIYHSCGYLRENAHLTNVRDFIQDRDSNFGEVLEIAWRPEPTMTAIYRAMVSRIDDDPLIARALDLLTLCGANAVPLSVLATYLGKCLNIKSPSLRLYAAKLCEKKLVGYSLADRYEFGLSLHKLTAEILDHILRDRTQSYLDLAYGAILTDIVLFGLTDALARGEGEFRRTIDDHASTDAGLGIPTDPLDLALVHILTRLGHPPLQGHLAVHLIRLFCCLMYLRARWYGDAGLDIPALYEFAAKAVDSYRAMDGVDRQP